MLTVHNVTKKYGSFTALENIDLTFDTGVHALLSPNGAGKTTLMKMLATLMHPTQGEILWDGEDIFRLDERYRDILGFLPQQFGYYKGYTVRKFLQYFAALKDVPKAQVEERIHLILEQVGLSDNADMKMKKLSGGMLQRVGIAQALLNDPQLLILDEPTAGLDPRERVRFRNMLHELGKERTIILSTHIVSDIESIAENVVMFKDKHICYNAGVAQLCAMLDGKLFELPLSEHAGADAVFLSERQEADGTVYRFVSAAPPANAKPVRAGLEDVFLYVYREELGV